MLSAIYRISHSHRFLFSDYENDIEVEKDCDNFSVKEELSTNGNVIEKVIYKYT